MTKYSGVPNIDTGIAFSTDMGLFAPTALALESAVQNTPTLSQVDILAISLTAQAKDVLRRIAERKGATLNIHSLTDAAFAGASLKGRHVPKAALARLYLPQLVEGRVLYIDGDTLIRRDLSEAFRMPMQGKLLGGVRDYSCLRKAYKHKQGNNWSARVEMEQIVAPFPVESYINSGVLLMDCEAIRQEQGLADAMLRFDLADKYLTVDQDYINELFRGRILHLNPSWNASWGRQSMQAKWAADMGHSGNEIKHERARIVHYHGAEKPWRKLPKDRWKRSLRAVLAYKLALRNFQKRFPELSFQ